MSIKVEVDWNKDGFDVGIGGAVTGGGGDTFGETFGETFGGGGTVVAPAAGWGDDVSKYVRPLTGAISAEYGRDQSSALAPTVSGRAGVTLDNRDRRFSPRNTASPLYGKIKPARPVRITRTLIPPSGAFLVDEYDDIYGTAGITYTLFNGHTDDSPINPDLDSRTVTLSMVDSLADFNGQSISTALYQGVRSGDAINYILDACGWDADLRDIDPGASVFPWWYEDNTDALTALGKVLRSEGPPALLFVGDDGEIVFRDRHHRLLRDASVTSQGTWRASGPIEPVMQIPFSYDEAWSHLINSATVSVDVQRIGAPAVAWTSEATISLSANETRLVTAGLTGAFTGAIPPVSGTDYRLAAGAITASLIRTSGASAVIVLKAGAAGATVTMLQLRAQALETAYTVQVSATDAGSVSDFGPRNLPDDLPWCGVEDAQSVIGAIVAQRSQPLPIISARFLLGKNLTKSGMLLSRDLSDRVHVIESETYLDDDFYIESIKHDMTGEDDHSVTFGLEAAAAEAVNVARTDTVGQGTDEGHLGSGLDNPTTIAITDSDVPGHRLEEGVTGT